MHLKLKEVLTNVVIQIICITMINRKRKVHHAPVLLIYLLPFLSFALSTFSSLEGTHKTVVDHYGGYVEQTHLFKRISRSCYLEIINQVSG